jgi:hypothetical protein
MPDVMKETFLTFINILYDYRACPIIDIVRSIFVRFLYSTPGHS